MTETSEVALDVLRRALLLATALSIAASACASPAKQREAKICDYASEAHRQQAIKDGSHSRNGCTN